MKKNILIIKILVLAVGLVVWGCAAMQGLPQGSVLKSDYEGPFNGQFFWGTIKIRVYEAPGGYRPVLGQLDQEASSGTAFFRGEMKGSRLEAQFTIAYGTVTGELSADGNSMSGTYQITESIGEHGTWSAQKK
jgi:hypothetical protein